MDPQQLKRARRVSEWYGPARFGLFYHYGLYTGGGSSEDGPFNARFRYESVADFEAAAPDPLLVAENLTSLATTVGAKYIIFAMVHSCDRFAVMFPTKCSAFLVKTTRDYVGALANSCQKKKLRLMLYFPAAAGGHATTTGGPWIAEGSRNEKGFVLLLKNLIAEVAERYGGRISGFWMDGNNSEAAAIPAYIRTLYPNAIVNINNMTNHGIPEMDCGTTEFLATDADPIYCRPSALRRPHPRWNTMPPKRDFNEDIPTCNSWWHGSLEKSDDEILNGPYVKEPVYLVKEMLSSLGQRRQWNYALGIGPQIDGTAPPIFQPMIERMAAFMSWASEAIYDTQGGEGSALEPGWWNHGAFGSITVSLKDPADYYIHVTTPPTSNRLALQRNGELFRSIIDLRTGKSLQFSDKGCLDIFDLDWEDVHRFGAKVIKARLA
jgi:alpha-L-fucosidase